MFLKPFTIGRPGMFQLIYMDRVNGKRATFKSVIFTFIPNKRMSVLASSSSATFSLKPMKTILKTYQCKIILISFIVTATTSEIPQAASATSKITRTRKKMSCCAELQIGNDDNYSTSESEDEGVKRSAKNKSKKSEKKSLNVPYTKATPLFKAIEKQQWESVLMFLNTAKWSNSFFVSSTDHLKNPTPNIQCQTWVTSYDRTTNAQEWSQLPIHAAISYNAPAVVLQKMIELYPDCLKHRDHEDMLPVHLAFGFALPDPVLSLLLKAYPESAQERGPGGRLPHQCCELGPNKIRGEVFGLIAEQTSDLARNDQEASFKAYIVESHKKFGLDIANVSDEKDLKELINDLMEDRKQLGELKKKIKKATELAQRKAEIEHNKSTSLKSPKGERKIKSPKGTSVLKVETESLCEDAQNLSLAGNTPTLLSPINSAKQYSKTPDATKPELDNKDFSAQSRPKTPKKSRKYSSRLSNNQVIQ